MGVPVLWLPSSVSAYEVCNSSSVHFGPKTSAHPSTSCSPLGMTEAPVKEATLLLFTFKWILFSFSAPSSSSLCFTLLSTSTSSLLLTPFFSLCPPFFCPWPPFFAIAPLSLLLSPFTFHLSAYMHIKHIKHAWNHSFGPDIYKRSMSRLCDVIFRLALISLNEVFLKTLMS